MSQVEEKPDRGRMRKALDGVATAASAVVELLQKAQLQLVQALQMQLVTLPTT
jgi:hypothetical protein